MNMRILHLIWIFLPALAVQQAAAEWKPLFNGRDLSGWDTSRSRSSTKNSKWTIEDGVLVGAWDPEHPGPGWLLTQADYGDFRLRLEFWITRGGNSGVAVRDASHGAKNPAYAGYEIQILSNDAQAKNPTGSIYGVAAAPGGLLREEQWNQMEVICKGPSIRVLLNGREVANAVNERSSRGAIGFQVHGRLPHNDLAKFRNVMIEVLE